VGDSVSDIALKRSELSGALLMAHRPNTGIVGSVGAMSVPNHYGGGISGQNDALQFCPSIFSTDTLYGSFFSTISYSLLGGAHSKVPYGHAVVIRTQPRPKRPK